jgi:hypothetical protein
MTERARHPTHKMTLYERGGRITVFEQSPIGREPGTFYCKYCYTTHRNWWRMPDEPPVILCGRCEYTSLIEFAQVDE